MPGSLEDSNQVAGKKNPAGASGKKHHKNGGNMDGTW